MDYNTIYNNFMQSRKNRTLDIDTKYEQHHIIPRSMGGTDAPSNLVYLTVKEHYVAHKLLWKANPTGREETMALRIHFNCIRKWGVTYVNSNFESAYESAISYWNSGENSPVFGMEPTEAMLAGYKTMSSTKAGRTKHNHTGIASRSEKMIGRTKHNHTGTAAQSAKLSDRHNGRGNPNCDPTVYSFENVNTGQTVTSDRYGMTETFGVDLTPLFSKKQPSKTCKGWKLLGKAA